MISLSSSLRRILTYASLRKCALISTPSYSAKHSAINELSHQRSRYPELKRYSSSSYDTKPILPDVWEFYTQPFGKLIVEAPFHVEVRPLDPLSCPNQDRLQVTLKSDEEQLLPDWMEGVECQVDHDPKKHILRVFGGLTERGYSLFPSLESLPVYLEVFIPIKYDVDILTHHHGRVSLKGLECESVVVKTESGMSNLGGLKAAKIQVSSSFGDINVGGSLYGDVELLTRGAGSISVHKIQGTLNASTDSGALWIKSAYLNRCALSSTGGDIRVTNLTGEDNQIESLHGDVALDSVDGCLETRSQTGNINATFSRVPPTASLVGILGSDSGDIELKVESDVSANVFLAGEEIRIGEGLMPVTDDEETEKANVSANNSQSNDGNIGYPDRATREESELSLRQMGVKVGLSDSEAVIHAVSKLGKVSLLKKEWFGAFKFGS